MIIRALMLLLGLGAAAAVLESIRPKGPAKKPATGDRPPADHDSSVGETSTKAEAKSSAARPGKNAVVADGSAAAAKKPAKKTAAKKEVQKAEADKPAAKPSAKKAAAKKSSGATKSDTKKPDDLKKQIEGIGPKIAELLEANGIATYAQLAAAEVGQLRSILDAGGGGFRLADPGTWPQQAALAAAGEWKKLAELQKELKGGRRSS